MLIDTHTHLYLEEFEGERNDVIRRAIANCVQHMIFPNVDLTTIRPMTELHEKFPEATSMAMGLHPTEIGEQWRDDLAAVGEHLGDGSKFVAVGEIGIDLYWDKTFAEQQMQALDTQLGWAAERELPVIIHCREGLDQTLEVLQSYPSLRGVMHSFGGTSADVDKVRRVVDFHFGINGIVTFKNSRLADSLDAIGTDRLLLETDSPYLAPVPKRGQRNESSYLVYTATFIADRMGMPLEQLAELTTNNAQQLFNLKH